MSSRKVSLMFFLWISDVTNFRSPQSAIPETRSWSSLSRPNRHRKLPTSKTNESLIPRHKIYLSLKTSLTIPVLSYSQLILTNAKRIWELLVICSRSKCSSFQQTIADCSNCFLLRKMLIRNLLQKLKKGLIVLKTGNEVSFKNIHIDAYKNYISKNTSNLLWSGN